MTHEETAHIKMIRARTGLLLEHPFFGSLALRLRMKADPACETAWSDGIVFGYNPAYINHLPEEKVLGLMAHTVMHPACRHHVRKGDREPNRWNMACDYAINWILLEAGLTLPDGYLDEPGYREMPAEEIYAVLAKGSRKPDGNVDTNPPPGQTAEPKGEEEEGDAPGENDSEKEASPSPDSPESNREEGEAEGEENTGASEGEDPDGGAADPGMAGEVRTPSAEGGEEVGEAELKALETEAKIALAQAAAQARTIGNLPAGLERMVNRILRPKLHWRELLKRFVEETVRNDFSWMPPSRRHIHMGLYLPSLANRAPARIVVAVDTSGSVSGDELTAFAAELAEIVHASESEITVIPCDRRVGTVQHFTRQDTPFSLSFSGGGGTDFRPPFKWLEENGIAPAGLIYLTDLACRTYPEEPPFPVLWAVPPGCQGEPPFGEVIEIH